MRNQPGLLRYVCHLMLSGMLVLTTTPGWAEVRDVTPEEATEIQNRSEESGRAGGRATLGGRIGDNQAEGYLDVLQPLAGGERGLLFFNPKLSGSDNDEEEYSLGLGLRVLCPATEAIAGLNVFYDSRDTQNGNTFDQVGAGVEVLTTWVDARANYYWPDDKSELIESQSDTEVDRNTDYYLSDIYAEGHELLQLERIKTTTTTTTRHFERFEAALEGYDAELGVKLPFLPDWLETRLFAGYYNFEGDYTDDIDGLKGRLEIRALPALTLDAEVYDNDDLTGSDYFFGARVNLPFDVVNLAHGKNPFAGTAAALQARQAAFADRLSEMVIRDPHVRIHESGYIENEGLKEVDVDVDVDEDELVVMDDINFVSNGNASGYENGTDEHPYNTVQEGVDNAFGKKNVYVYQGTGAYHENVTIEEDGISLMGEGCAIEGYGGKKFGGGKYPALDGNVAGVNGPVIRVSSDNVLVRGLELTRTAGGVNPGLTDALGLSQPIDQVGVLAENADNLTIGCNLIRNQLDGVLALYDPTEPGAPLDLNLQVLNNRFEDSTMGVRFYGLGAGGRFQGLVQDNDFANVAGFELMANLTLVDEVDLDVLGNTFLDANSFALVSLGIQQNVDLTFRDNLFTQGGILSVLLGPTSGDADIDLSGNRLLGSSSILSLTAGGGVAGDQNLRIDDNYIENGIISSVWGPVGGDSFLSISGNTLVNPSGGAITLIGGTVGQNSTVVLDDNTIQNAAGGGITAVLGEAGDLNVSLSGNDIRNSAGAGVTLVNGAVTGNTLLVMSDNVVTGSQGSGITAVLGSTSGRVDVVAERNRVIGNQGTGLFLGAGTVGGDANVAITDSAFDDNVGGGLFVSLPDVQGDLTLLIDPTTANRNGGGGITVNLASVGDTFVTLEDVTANDNNGSGISVLANSSSGSVQAAFINVQAHRNTGVGLLADVTAEQDVFLLDGDLSGPRGLRVQANQNGGPGIILNAASTGGAVMVVSHRLEAGGNAGPGISATLNAPETLLLFLGDLVANTNVGSGVTLTANSASNSIQMFMSSLTAQRNGSTGAAIDLSARENIMALFGYELIPLSDLPPAGPIQVSGNGGLGLVVSGVSASSGVTMVTGSLVANTNAGPGTAITLVGEDTVQAVLGLGGSLTTFVSRVVQLNGNTGGGLIASLNSSRGDAGFAIWNGEANGNVGPGVNVSVTGREQVSAGLGALLIGGAPVDFSGSFSAISNAGPGVVMSAISTNDNAILVHTEGELSNNQGPGGVYTLQAKQNVSAILGGYFLAPGDAINNLVATNNQGSGIILTAASESGQASVFTEGLKLNHNAQLGMQMTVSAAEEVNVILGLDLNNPGDLTTVPLEFNDNGLLGASINAVSISNSVDISLPEFEASRNQSVGGLSINAAALRDVSISLGALAGVMIPTNLPGNGVANANQGFGLQVFGQSASGDVSVLLGPIEASGNLGVGMSINATAAELASVYSGMVPGLLGSLTAVTNGADGIQVTVTGDEAILGLGDTQANRNTGDGVRAVVAGVHEATAVLGLANPSGTNLQTGLVQANGNGGNGLNLDVSSPSGSVTAVVAAFQANDNGAYGVTVGADAFSNATVNLGSYVGPVTVPGEGEASGNALAGIDLNVAAQGSITTVVANVTAVTNATAGLQAVLVASNDVTATLNNAVLNANGATGGFDLRYQAGSNAMITVENVQASNNDGPNFVRTVDPSGNAVVTVRNDTVTNNGSSIGLFAGAVANHSATVVVENVVANDNFMGMDLYARAVTDSASIRVSNVVANGNTTRGVEAETVAGGGASSISLQDVAASGNGTYGVWAQAAGVGAVDASVTLAGDLTVNNNQTGALLVAISGQSATVNANSGDQVTAISNVNHGIVGAAEGNNAGVSLTAGAVPAVNNNGQFGLVALAAGTNSAFAAAANGSGTGNGSGNEHVDTAATGPWQALLP